MTLWTQGQDFSLWGSLVNQFQDASQEEYCHLEDGASSPQGLHLERQDPETRGRDHPSRVQAPSHNGNSAAAATEPGRARELTARKNGTWARPPPRTPWLPLSIPAGILKCHGHESRRREGIQTKPKTRESQTHNQLREAG
jgi:hypothetical protein